MLFAAVTQVNTSDFECTVIDLPEAINCCWPDGNRLADKAAPDAAVVAFKADASFVLHAADFVAMLVDDRWQHVSFSFKAPAAQTTLMIQDISGQNYFQGLALDGLKVTPS